MCRIECHVPVDVRCRRSRWCGGRRDGSALAFVVVFGGFEVEEAQSKDAECRRPNANVDILARLVVWGNQPRPVVSDRGLQRSSPH